MRYSLDKNKQLQWACRRGMLELDILLNRFLNEKYLSLSAEQQAQFFSLLTYSDTELYDWLVQRKQSETMDPHIKTLIEQIIK